MKYVQNKKTQEILSLTSVTLTENSDFSEFTIQPGIHGFLSVIIIAFSAFFTIFSLIVLAQMSANFSFDGVQILIMIFLLLFFLMPSGLLLYFSLRPKCPLKISLFREHMQVDTGLSPVQWPSTTFDVNEWMRALVKLKRNQFSINSETALQSQLTNQGKRLNLRIFNGDEFIDVADTTSNVAREVIFNYIQEYYRHY